MQSSSGLKVSRIGFDVNEASDKQLAFNSEWTLLPIEAEGDFDVTDDMYGLTSVDIFTHNLGYAPVFMVCAYMNNGETIDDISGMIDVYCNSTKLYGVVSADYDQTTFVRKPVNCHIHWKIFRRDIVTQYSSPNINITDATKEKDGDYGFIMTLPGKDIRSKDLRDFSIRSDVRQLMVAKSGYTQNTRGENVYHGLGYKPMYLFYIERDHLGNIGNGTFKITGTADDARISSTEDTLTYSFNTYSTQNVAYILFKDTLMANG